jgi:hypothetical protein
MSDGAHPITDEFMRSMLAASRTYTLVVLTPGPNYDGPGAQGVIWEHGRRNFELRAAGTLAIVGPVRDESDLAGIGIFTTDLAETAALMEQDPAIAGGVLVASVHPLTGFPGDALPGDALSGGALPGDGSVSDSRVGEKQVSDDQVSRDLAGDHLSAGNLPGESATEGAPA